MKYHTYYVALLGWRLKIWDFNGREVFSGLFDTEHFAIQYAREYLSW